MLSYFQNLNKKKLGVGGKDRHEHHGAMVLTTASLDMVPLTTFVDSACVKLSYHQIPGLPKMARSRAILRSHVLAALGAS